jgi:glycosyltransferase involved in cell wall biosynthesis
MLMSQSGRTHALLVTPVLPDRAGTGAPRRAYQWVIQLAQAHQLHVLVAGGVDPASPALAHLRTIARVLIAPLRWRRRTRERWAAILCPPLVLGRRQGVLGWLSLDAEDALRCRALFEGVAFQRVVAFRLNTHDVAALQRSRQGGDCLFEMDLDDLESSAHRSMLGLALRRRFWRKAVTHASTAMHMRLLERTLLRHYDCVYLACNEDTKRLRKRHSALTVRTLENRFCRLCVPADPVTRQPRPLTLVFIGLLSYLPNEDAALWIARSLCPALRAHLCLPFRVLIAGRGASRTLQAALSTVPEIEFQGEVDQVSRMYDRADIAIIPLRGGSGTKIKFLEALAHRCPVVATSHSVRGTAFRDGVHYLAAESAAAFAAACLHLAQNPDSRAALCDAGSALLRQEYLARPEMAHPSAGTLAQTNPLTSDLMPLAAAYGKGLLRAGSR